VWRLRDDVGSAGGAGAGGGAVGEGGGVREVGALGAVGEVAEVGEGQRAGHDQRARESADGAGPVAFDLSNHPRAASLIGQGNIKLHFRSEAARVVPAGNARARDSSGDGPGGIETGIADDGSQSIRLPGSVEQTAYLGEHWRCRVRMGSARVWVDTTTPLAVGSTAVVQVPVSALHLFAAAQFQ
jgi:hypothetical protein